MNATQGSAIAGRHLAMVGLLALTPWLFAGVHGALRSNSNDPRQWLPRGFAETDTYDWLQQHFGRDEMAIVSWPGCTLDNPQVEQFAAAVTADDGPGLFQRVVTGPAILQQLTTGPLGLTRREAIDRLQGVLVGPDRQTTCVVVIASDQGLEDRVAAVEHIYTVAGDQFEIGADQLRLAGPTVDAATIDAESQRLLLELAGVSGLLAFFVCWLRLRSIRQTLLVLTVAIYSTGAALAVLYYTGGNMNLVMTMLPPLIFVLTISGSVHLVNYYREAAQASGMETAPARAIAAGWWLCTLASATTAVGLLSLASSDTVPVKMFGIYAAAGMILSLLVMLAMLPIGFRLFPTPPPSEPRPSKETGVPWLDRLTGLLCRRHAVLTVGCITLMLVSAVGLFRLRSTVKLQYRFGAKSKILRDYRWMEQQLGPLVPLEIVLRFAPDCELGFLEQMQIVANVQQRLSGATDVGAVMSAADFAPEIPAGRSVQDVIERSMLRKKLPASRDRFVDAHFLADGDGSGQLWRISVRATALSDIDYGRFTEKLQAHVEPMLAGTTGVDATYTGVIPLIYKAQRELLNDLIESFLLAFAVIALVMMVLLRSITAGLLAMLPNVFPAVVIFGAMGWSNIWIEIGSVMTASAALGIAVDDTLHFLTWFRRASRDGGSRHQALSVAYRHCARAMLNTTLICASGLLVFSFSSFMPIVRFAWLMAALLLTALLGDLIFLPAMLAGPLGRFFQLTSDRQVSSTGPCCDTARQPRRRDRVNLEVRHSAT